MDYNYELEAIDKLKNLASTARLFYPKPAEQVKWNQFYSNIKILKDCLKEKALPTVITFHLYGGLYPLLMFTLTQIEQSTKILNKISSETEKQNIKSCLLTIFNLVYNTTFDSFLTYVSVKPNEDYIGLYEKGQKYLQKQQIKDSSSLHILLNQLIRIDKNSDKQNQTKRKSVNIFISGHLMMEKAESPLQQIALNWIKIKTESVQSQDRQRICCRIIFEHKQTTVLGAALMQSENQQFKDYRWPLENQSIKNHLTKTIVGYLNTTGGIIYVGLKEDKHKMIEVKGIKLNSQQKIQFLYFLHDQIMKGVYPKQNERKIDEEQTQKNPSIMTDYRKKLKEQFQSSQKKSQYRINRFVQVDFINIFDKQTYLVSKEDNCNLYIVRIKIKIGDMHELYHIINPDKNIPEAFFRQDKSVKKKSMQQFYKFFYERIAGKLQNKPQKGEAHSYCRFNPSFHSW